jgi:hypothetical protein
MKTRRDVSLLAIELNGYSSVSLDTARSAPTDTIVVAQQPLESTGKFAVRLVERIRRLQRRGVGVSTAVLACGHRSDAEAIGGRFLLVRTLLATCAGLSDTNLSIVSAGGRAVSRYQHQAILQTIREHELSGTLRRVA